MRACSYVKAVALMLLVLATTWPESALAQSVQGPTGTVRPEDENRARELYSTGANAVENGDAERGLEMFERSFELSGAYLPLYGIAVVLAELTRFDEAYDAAVQLLARDDLPADLRRNAVLLRDRCAREVALLQVRDLPEPGGELRLELNGISHPDSGMRPLTLALLPGTHDVGARWPGNDFFWDGDLRAGQRVSISALEESDPFYSTTWFWVVTGTAVAVVAGIIVGVVLHNNAQLDPSTENVLAI